MSRNAKAFFFAFSISFVALAIVSIVFEFFETGDDPIYSMKEAGKNLALAVIVSTTTVWQISKGKSTEGQNDA